MENIDTAKVASFRAIDTAHERAPGSNEEFTPTDFLKQVGAIIAVCLGLALLAQALVMMVGVY